MVTKIYFKIAILFLALIFTTGVYAIPIAGRSTGSFINPTGPGGVLVSGVGTIFFTWGDGRAFGSPPGSERYTGYSFSGETNNAFSFGALSYFNGTIAGSTKATAVDLDLTLTLTGLSGINEKTLTGYALMT